MFRRRRFPLGSWWVSSVLAQAVVGCARPAPPPPAPVLVVAAATSEPEPEAVTVPAAPLHRAVELLDDCEDANNQILLVAGRSGYWYTYADDSGTEVWPTPGARGGTLEMSPPGRDGSAYAARIHGRIGQGDVSFAGVGFNFVDPMSAFDASAYAGLVFWARSVGDGAAQVRVKVPDVNTDPNGGRCSECFNDFGATVELTAEYAEHVLLFRDLRQLDGWGSPRPPAITPQEVFAVRFELAERGAPFDVYIDDVAFVKE